MTQTFGDLTTASRMKALMKSVAEKVVDQKRPEERIGLVVSLNSAEQFVMVRFNGDPTTIRVRVALNMLPTHTEDQDGAERADIVRVAGKPGSYYVTDFVRGMPQSTSNISVGEINFANYKGINLADATDPQDALNKRTGDALYGGREPAIPAGATSQYFRGDKTWQTLNKAAVGLSAVDNTSDMAKPISTATQVALNAKANAANPTFTGTVTGVTKAMVGLGNVPNVDTTNAGNITSGQLPTSVLPPLAINETFTVNSQAAMLALVAERGDMAVRSDFTPARLFICVAEPSSVLGNWREITAAGSVLSVAGKIGAVTLGKSDVGLANVDNTADANKPVSGPQQTALNFKANDADVVKLSGDQVINGIKKIMAPVAVGLQSADPAPSVMPGTPMIFARQENGLPYWRDVNGIVRPLITPREAVHPNPNLEEWTGPVDKRYPVGWTRFWMGADTITNEDASDKVSGGYSFKITRPGAGANNTAFMTDAAIACNPGDSINFEFYAKASNASGVLAVSLYSAATSANAGPFGSGVVQATKTVNMSATWAKYSFSWTVPQGHYFFRFSIQPYTLASSAMDFWIDDTGSSITTPQEVIVLEDWQTPVLENGWTAWGNGYPSAAYRREGKKIYLRGVVKSGTIGSAIFTLPEGFRPANPLILTGAVQLTSRNTGTPNTGTSHFHASYTTDNGQRMNIGTNGAVALHNPGSVTIGANQYFSLDGVMFFTD